MPAAGKSSRCGCDPGACARKMRPIGLRGSRPFTGHGATRTPFSSPWWTGRCLAKLSAKAARSKVWNPERGSGSQPGVAPYRRNSGWAVFTLQPCNGCAHTGYGWILRNPFRVVPVGVPTRGRREARQPRAVYRSPFRAFPKGNPKIWDFFAASSRKAARSKFWNPERGSGSQPGVAP